MTDIPEGVPWGIVTANIVEIISDTADPDRVPDVTGISGTVTLRPLVAYVRFPAADPPTYARVGTLTCPLIGGVLYPPGTTAELLPEDPGVPVIATDQPDGEPNLVQWEASFELDGIDAPPSPVTFSVPGGGLAVDLSAVVGEQVEPPQVIVVSSEDRILAQAAAATAEEAAITATAAAGDSTQSWEGAEAARVAAETARDEAVEAAEQASDPISTAEFDAAQVVTGVFDPARIPDLPAGKITGEFAPEQVPVQALSGTTLERINLATPRHNQLWYDTDLRKSFVYINGVWQADELGDTGWVDLSSHVVASGTGTIRGRKRAGVVTILANLTVPVASGSQVSVSTALPEQWRPLGDVVGGAYLATTGAVIGISGIRSSGTLWAMHGSGASKGSVFFSLTYQA